jgi:hypothetical protein
VDERRPGTAPDMSAWGGPAVGTWFGMTSPHRRVTVALAGFIGLLMALLFAGTARAGGGCQITIEPSTIAAGGQFVVSGNFGAGAEVHLVPGEDVAPPEDSEPVYTVPEDRSSFSATITMGADTQGTWTVWGLIPATECGDSAILTVTGTVPDTATDANGRGESSALLALGALLLVLAITLMSLPRFTAAARQSSP